MSSAQFYENALFMTSQLTLWKYNHVTIYRFLFHGYFCVNKRYISNLYIFKIHSKTGQNLYEIVPSSCTVNSLTVIVRYLYMHCCSIFHSITCVFCCLVPLERLVINKERLAGWYRLSAYYLAKMTSELVLILVQPLFFITVVYWSVGLNGVSSYFATLGTLFIHAITGQVI